MSPNWILAGDLNETRTGIDRKRSVKPKSKPQPEKKKFVDLFLCETGGMDVWRGLFADKPGFTYRNDQKNSFSRLDYFIVSPKLSASHSLDMKICNWELKKDHCRISLELLLPETAKSKYPSNPWSIPQPDLRHLSERNKQLCRDLIEESLKPIQQLVDIGNELDPTEADRLSVLTAETLILTVGQIAGMKKATHRKGRFESLDINKAKAEISTINKARDLIRSLAWEEFKTRQDKTDSEEYLKVCLGNTSIPPSLDTISLSNWAETTALKEIENITLYIKSRRQDFVSQEKVARQKLFLDPKERGKWLEKIFGSTTSTCPNFAIDSITGLSTSEPSEVKRIYLREGSAFLKAGISCPPPFAPEKPQIPEPHLI